MPNIDENWTSDMRPSDGRLYWITAKPVHARRYEKPWISTRMGDYCPRDWVAGRYFRSILPIPDYVPPPLPKGKA